jgi:predicted TIM-barrel fold metal-dependent hydrolase
MINDCYADLVRWYPKRFRAFATVPLPHLHDALTGLDRAASELGMLGVTPTTTIAGKSLTDPVLRAAVGKSSTGGGRWCSSTRPEPHQVARSRAARMMLSVSMPW